MDAFFAAVEQLDHPEWRGRPVIVGGPSSGRGVVSAASYEARRYGVRSAMASARAERLCPEAIWARPRFERYREMSDAVLAILEQFTPHVQPVSIDEAYLDVTAGKHASADPVAVAEEVQSRVEALGITCSIGVASSKTVAKIASDHLKPNGLVVVYPGDEAAFLAPMSCGALPGIGPKTAAALASRGIRTLGELAALDEGTAAAVLGTHGPELVMRASGIDSRRVRRNPPAKSVSNERTFAEDLRSREEVERALESLCERVARRIRRKGISGRTVTLKLRFSDFTTRTVQQTMPQPTHGAEEILSATLEMLSDVWRPGVGLRLLGVGVSGFEERGQQLELLEESREEEDDGRRRRLTAGLDAVRERFGDDAVKRGREVAGDSSGKEEKDSEKPGSS